MDLVEGVTGVDGELPDLLVVVWVCVVVVSLGMIVRDGVSGSIVLRRATATAGSRSGSTARHGHAFATRGSKVINTHFTVSSM